MKIGFVLDDTLDNPNGIQQYMLCVGRWLQKHGHEVYYIVGESHRTDVENMFSVSTNINVRFNGNKLSMPAPASYKKLRWLLDDLKLDVLHVQAPYSPFLAGRLIRSVKPSVAVVGTFHILPYSRASRLGSDILGKINTSTAKRFDAMMAVSAPTQVFAGRYYGFRSIVVANPFYHDQFSVARRGKNKPHVVKKIVFLGRLVTRKGPRELLEAVALLYSTNLTKVKYEVTIAGRGPLLNELNRFVEKQGLSKVVTFTGFVEENKKAELLASGDLVVFPSTSGESFGISLLEGMAASQGVVLAGDNLGYACVVADKKQLFNPRDTEAFAKLLANWLDDDTGRESMARLQQQYVRQYDIDEIGPKIVAVYNQALQKRPRS
ncbi:glycosyltransferase family 4 protein [Candidatus Saccharibacteria bacterium]|nr:MAG: glycosyltransferase family 4 protein [Candidatus Saccharibacteria bacterium]